MTIIARETFNKLTGTYAQGLNRFSPNGWSPFPLFVNCILTYACNMECPFCVAGPGRVHYPHLSMPADSWKRILDQIPRWTLLGFSGGEIFCHPEMYPILQQAARRNRIVFVTNGISFDDRSTDRIIRMGAKNLWNSGLVQIGISINEAIDGPERCASVLKEKIELFERLADERRRQGRNYPRLELKVLIRDDTAPFLDLLAQAVRYPSVDSVTFQMQTSQLFFCYLALDPNDRHRVETLRRYKDGQGNPIRFEHLEELENAFARLAALPRFIRERVGFLPPLHRNHYLDHYSGNPDLSRFHCTNPWMHIMIDPNGVAFQCMNAEGVDLKRIPFRTAWNDPRLRAFRVEVRDRKTFPRCAGCCFLQPLPGSSGGRISSRNGVARRLPGIGRHGRAVAEPDPAPMGPQAGNTLTPRIIRQP
jgi:MoaA/NifB/PqqE/SkfB family radical SAM enzyme